MATRLFILQKQIQLSTRVLYVEKAYLFTVRSPERKVIGKAHPRTGNEGPEQEYRYCSTLSLTSAIEGMGGQRHDHVALPPGNRTLIICT